MAKSLKTWEFGDFQTPLHLARSVVTRLREQLSFQPRTIIEPTCGVGAFIIAAGEVFADVERIVGVDIDVEYLARAREGVDGAAYQHKVSLIHDDFFKVCWADLLETLPKPILIIGNPPWVTNADIGLIKGSNLPRKSNFQKHRGLDAITGKANFDISEWMILRNLEWIEEYGGGVAMLCKTAVARKVLQSCWKAERPIGIGSCFHIDAMASFGAAVDACCFVVEHDQDHVSTDCLVFDSLDDAEPDSVFGWHNGMVIADVHLYNARRTLVGKEEHYIWRSGIKHDCSKVMELRRTADGLQNGLGEMVVIEDHFLFPLLKSSDVAKGNVEDIRLDVIVTQRRVGEDTRVIADMAPCTWGYLVDHRDLLARRGSIIYKNKPEFSVFGIGDYSFMPWKIAISGFYKHLSFQLIPPHHGKPVMVDDTVYFLGCSDEDEARFLWEILTSVPAKEALSSMIFWNDKRPVTADLLKRLNLAALAEALGRGDAYRFFTERARNSAQGELVLAK
ncbi:hypothetical protein [uncultured Sphingomonas sp.]|uniref:hypothetical protein n=1 Tax=uncultured Sphingomonas sp. TaxID=158754 RepID=UPI0025D4BFB7|nr:hypothetical protein [uncultured Sphingomonas sp.]